jgi:hypothetical protein
MPVPGRKLRTSGPQRSARRAVQAVPHRPGIRWTVTRHDVRVAVSISHLVERFYGELWNRWNDPAVEDTLGPGFAFRGSLGQ